jgi:hypothetical protein
MTFFSQARRTCETTHFIHPCTILCVCFLQFDWLIFLGNYYHVDFKKGREAWLTLEGEVVALGRLTLISVPFLFDIERN